MNMNTNTDEILTLESIGHCWVYHVVDKAVTHSVSVFSSECPGTRATRWVSGGRSGRFFITTSKGNVTFPRSEDVRAILFEGVRRQREAVLLTAASTVEQRAARVAAAALSAEAVCHAHCEHAGRRHTSFASNTAYIIVDKEKAKTVSGVVVTVSPSIILVTATTVWTTDWLPGYMTTLLRFFYNFFMSFHVRIMSCSLWSIPRIQIFLFTKQPDRSLQ